MHKVGLLMFDLFEAVLQMSAGSVEPSTGVLWSGVSVCVFVCVRHCIEIYLIQLESMY